MNRIPILVAILVAFVFIALNAVFTVDERQKAMVLQFGQVKAIKTEPGLAFKTPSSRTSSITTGASRGSTPTRSK